MQSILPGAATRQKKSVSNSTLHLLFRLWCRQVGTGLGIQEALDLDLSMGSKLPAQTWIQTATSWIPCPGVIHSPACGTKWHPN